MPRPLCPLAACAVVLLTACVSMAAPGVSTERGVLVNEKSMTLYTYDKDVAGSGRSACSGTCAANWPPVLAGATDMASGDWSIALREDGSRQWAYKGRPLYRWLKDQKPGDTFGDGINQMWRTAKP